MSAVNLSPAVAEEFDITGADSGVVVTNVAPRSPAQQVGLQKGDVLVQINGVDIASTDVLMQAVAERARIWRFEVLRDGRVLRMAVSG
ncbi:MAG: PDZ domain-containing protein [Hyphomicrobiales bacterium]